MNTITKFCQLGVIDSLIVNLKFLYSIQVITDDIQEDIYSFLPKLTNDDLSNIQGFNEIVDWTRKLYVCYEKYKSFSSDILNLIDDDVLHELSYLKPYINKKSTTTFNTPDVTKLDCYYKNLVKFYPNEQLTQLIIDVYNLLDDISENNQKEILKKLYLCSRTLDYSCNYSEPIKRKLRSIINTLSLEIQSMQSNKKSSFYYFLKDMEVVYIIYSKINKILHKE